MIKFVSDLRQGWWFSVGIPVSSTNKTDRHDITETNIESGVKLHNPNHIYYCSVYIQWIIGFYFQIGQLIVFGLCIIHIDTRIAESPRRTSILLHDDADVFRGIYSQACLKVHIDITNHCLSSAASFSPIHK